MREEAKLSEVRVFLSVAGPVFAPICKFSSTMFLTKCIRLSIAVALFPVYVAQLDCLFLLDLARRSANLVFLLVEGLLRPKCLFRKVSACFEDIGAYSLKRTDQIESFWKWFLFWLLKAHQIPERIDRMVDLLVRVGKSDATYEYLVSSTKERSRHPIITNCLTGSLDGSFRSQFAESFGSWETRGSECKYNPVPEETSPTKNETSAGELAQFEDLNLKQGQQSKGSSKSNVQSYFPRSHLAKSPQWRLSWVPQEKTVHEDKEVAVATFWPDFLLSLAKERIAKAKLPFRKKTAATA